MMENHIKCPVCNGHGGMDIDYVCEGDLKQVLHFPCDHCAGNGFIEKPKPVERDGFSLRCVLFGHDKYRYKDRGYNIAGSSWHVCPRCGKHEYFDCEDVLKDKSGSDKVAFGAAFDHEAVLFWPWRWFVRQVDRPTSRYDESELIVQ